MHGQKTRSRKFNLCLTGKMENEQKGDRKHANRGTGIIGEVTMEQNGHKIVRPGSLNSSQMVKVLCFRSEIQYYIVYKFAYVVYAARID